MAAYVYRVANGVVPQRLVKFRCGDTVSKRWRQWGRAGFRRRGGSAMGALEAHPPARVVLLLLLLFFSCRADFVFACGATGQSTSFR